jgi:2'-5' RNA ligase
MKRTFLAVRAHTQELKELLAELTDDRELRVTREESLHVTCQFLGALEEPDLASLTAELERRAMPPRFSLALTGLSTFAGRVLYARVAPSDGFESLADVVDDVVDEVLGGAQSVRAMVSRQVPHVTVGRPRGRGRSLRAWARRYKERALGGFDVEELVLFESRQASRGPNEYVPLSVFPLS